MLQYVWVYIYNDFSQQETSDENTGFQVILTLFSLKQDSQTGEVWMQAGTLHYNPYCF